MNKKYRSMRMLIGPLLMLCLALLFCRSTRAAQDGKTASDHSDAALSVNISSAQEVYFRQNQGSIPVTVELSGEDAGDVSLIKLSYAVNGGNTAMTMAEPAKMTQDGLIRAEFIVKNVITQDNGTVDMPLKIDVLDENGILKKSEIKRIQTNAHIYNLTAGLIGKDQDLEDLISRGLKTLISGNESFTGMRTKVIQAENLMMLDEIPDLYTVIFIDRPLSEQESEIIKRWILGGGSAMIETSSQFLKDLNFEDGDVHGYGSGKICCFSKDSMTKDLMAGDIFLLCKDMLYDTYSVPAVYAYDLTAYDAFSRPANIWAFRIILLLFVLIAGPGVYLFLKRRDALEYVWIGIPVSAACFALIVFTTGIPSRLSDPFVRYYSIIQLTDEGTDKNTLFSVTSPDDDPVFFSVSREMNINSEASADLYDGNTEAMTRALNDTACNIVMTEDDQETQVMIKDDSIFSSQYFTAHKFSGQEDEKAELIAEITYDNGLVNGFVTNHTAETLDSVFAVCDNIFVKIGRLSPGETKHLENIDDYVFGIDSLMQERFCRSLAEELDAANPSAMTIQIRDMLMNRDTMTDYPGFIGGFTQDHKPVIDGISPDAVKGVSFYMQSDISWQPAKGRRMEMAVAGFYDMEDADNADMAGEEDMYPVYYDYSETPKTYCYRFDTDYMPDYIKWLNPEEGASCEWYNIKTGSYDRVFESGQAISGQKITDYLDAGHVLRIRFLGAGEYMIPVFSAFGGETDD